MVGNTPEAHSGGSVRVHVVHMHYPRRRSIKGYVIRSEISSNAATPVVSARARAKAGAAERVTSGVAGAGGGEEEGSQVAGAVRMNGNAAGAGR